MCGIAGIYSWQKKQKVPEQKIENMISAQFHRGPDECGFLYDQNFAMGMSRLSIIDLSGGSQPIHNEDKSIWIVSSPDAFSNTFFPVRSCTFTRTSPDPGLISMCIRPEEGFG